MTAKPDALAVKSPVGGLTFIEQLHALAIVRACPSSGVPFMSGRKADAIILTRGACGLWSCPVCGARNGRKWLARLLKHMNECRTSGRWFFLTITAHKSWRGTDASVKNLRQGWKKLYNRMRRKYGVSEYVKVWEYHADSKQHDGHPTFHLHILIRRKIGKKWLKDNSAECGMGYMCDSSRAKNPGQVAGYVAKYLLKSFANADKYPRGLRRIEASRNWTKLDDMTSDIEQWTVYSNRTAQKEHADFLSVQHGVKIIDLVPSEKQIAKIKEKLQ